MSKPPADENDRFDKKHGDGDATLERDHNMAGLDNDGKYRNAPGEGDAADKNRFKAGEEVGKVMLIIIFKKAFECIVPNFIFREITHQNSKYY